MSRVFIIHGWGGGPDRDFIPWAKKELEKKNFEVITPEMPDTNYPKIDPWVNKLSETVGTPRPDDIFIGHSIGCGAVVRYLHSLPDNTQVKKVILIAPWQYLTLDVDEDPKVAEPWINEPVDWEKVKSKAGKIIAVFSKDDPYVPFQKNLEFFKDKLYPEIIVKDKMGHFTLTEIPFLLNLI